MPTGNSKIFFIHPSKIPTYKKVTYGRLVLDIRPLKEEKYRVRITVGSDKLDFCGDASSVAASLATVKLLLNSVVSTKGAKSTTADIKDFFYASFFARPRIHEDEIEDNSSINHRPISTSRSGRRWLGLHQDCKGQLVSNLACPLQSSCRPSHFLPDLGVDIGR